MSKCILPSYRFSVDILVLILNRPKLILPIFKHIIGFTTPNVHPEDVVSAGSFFISNFILLDQGVIETMLCHLATSSIFQTQDGIIVGTPSPTGPQWVVYVNRADHKANPFGLGLAPCPVPGCTTTAQQGRKFQAGSDNGRFTIRQSCTQHKKRTLDLTPPPEAIVPDYNTILRWKWPKTVQEYGWVDHGTSSRGVHANATVLKF